MEKRFIKIRSNITICLSFPPFPSPDFSPALYRLYLSVALASPPVCLTVSTSVLTCFHLPVSLSSLSVSITLSLSLIFPLSPFPSPLGRSPHRSRSLHSFSLSSVSHALCLSASRFVSPSVSPFNSPNNPSVPFSLFSPLLCLSVSDPISRSLLVTSHCLNPFLLVSYPTSR